MSIGNRASRSSESSKSRAGRNRVYSLLFAVHACRLRATAVAVALRLDLLRVVLPRHRARAVTQGHPARAITVALKHRLLRPATLSLLRGVRTAKDLLRAAAPQFRRLKMDLRKIAMRRPLLRTAAPGQPGRMRRRQQGLSRPIRRNPRRYSKPLPTEICNLCVTCTLGSHRPEAGHSVSVATRFCSVPGMRTNCRWIFPPGPITFSGRGIP
jgi:hypothetical protein